MNAVITEGGFGTQLRPLRMNHIKPSATMKGMSVLLALVATFVPLASRAQLPQALVRQWADTLLQHRAVRYVADVKFKFVQNKTVDTLPATVYLYRDSSDVRLGGWFRYEHGALQSGFSKSYYRDTQRYIARAKKHVMLYRVPEDISNPGRGNVYDDVIATSFFHPQGLLQFVDSSDTYSRLADTLVGSVPCYHIRVTNPGGPQFTNFTKDYYFARSPFRLVFTVATCWFQGDYQYYYFRYDSIRFDSFDTTVFSAYWPAEYAVEQYHRPEPRKPLDSGSVAPRIVGAHYGALDSLRLSGFRGKVVMLDFWYMSCMPCIQAFPHLDSLYRRFRDSGFVVLGIDSHDERRKDQLPEFFTKNPVAYPILLTDRSVDNDYHIEGYPTMYVIDRNGRIAASFVGYGDGVERQWEAALEPLLKKK